MDEEMIRITILYDNNGFGEGLQSDWGFSALIEHQGHSLLFDTGANGAILQMNMETLGVDPESIETVVLSHAHQDHTGGLDALLQNGLQARIFLLPSFDQAFKDHISQRVEVIEVAPGEEVAPGFRSTGGLGISPPEQALMVATTQGPILITGCAHPGIVTIVRKVVELTGEAPRLVMGGFHLRGTSRERVAQFIDELKELGVQQVAPCHCTGDQAIAAFASAFEDNFISVGVGSILELTP